MTSRLLVVDRSAEADDVADVLGGGGFDAVETTGPEPDVSLFGRFDCVVCGHDPPALDGVALLERTRERFEFLPFVLYPQAGDEALAGEALAAGASGYVPRGADAGTLRERVRTALSSNRPVRRLERLHRATRELMTARDPEAVAEIAAEAAADILGLEANGIWLYEDGRLVPAVVTDRSDEVIDSPPTFEPGGSLAWEVFESGESQRYGDLREASGLHNPETAMRSEMLLPLGEHGVFVAGSTTPNAFDEADARLAAVFASNVEAALTRADREGALRERERALRKQNDRLEEFTSVVSHDLRNPLNVATGRVELAAAECDSDHLDAVGRALDRMGELVEDLLTLARQGESVGETDPVELAALVRTVWDGIGGGSLELEDGLGRVEADRSRLRQLLENLLLNAVEHGGGDVTVTVGPLSEGGFYVEDDGPGIPVEERGQVFDHGFTTSEEGTGFGLAIVRRIAEAHGWSVAAAGGADGGARFEVRTDGDRSGAVTPE